MKPYYSIITFCFLLIKFATAQAVYRPVSDSALIKFKLVRNSTHIKVVKLPDSGMYMAMEYDSNDTLMASGTYKDSLLTIPHGKFKFYGFNIPMYATSYNYIQHKYDTILTKPENYLRKTGFYIDGKRSGSWVDYNDKHLPVYLETYERDTLNGPYKLYNFSGGVELEGNYINGFKEGKWNMLAALGDTMYTDIYKKGKIIKRLSYMNSNKLNDSELTLAKPTVEIASYLNQALKDIRLAPVEKQISFFFTVDSEGKIVKPWTLDHTNLPLNSAIIDALMNMPAWDAALRKGKKIETNNWLTLNITIGHNRCINVSLPHGPTYSTEANKRELQTKYELINQ